MSVLIILVVGFMIGLLLAWVVIDFSHRKHALSELKKAKGEFDETLKKLQSVNNDLVGKVLAIEEKVSAHDYQLNAKVGKK